MIDYNTVKIKLLSDSEVLAEYNNLELDFKIAEALIRARLTANLTQSQVAKKMATSQAQIARLESGNSLPSLSTVAKYAKAVNQQINIVIIP